MSYLGSAPSNQTPTYKQVYEYTATAGQTSFAASYTVGFVEVYRNGVKLGSSDFTATTGTTVVLASGASAGDFVQVVSLFISSTMGAIPNTAGAVATANIADGNVTAAKIASGQTFGLNGVAFPANQVPSSDANTLDDYEEGTWTPVFTNLGTVTLSSAKYVKIGTLCTASLLFSSSSNPTANSSRFTLPFNSIPMSAGSYSSGGTTIGGTLEVQANQSTCYFATSSASSTNVVCTVTYITA